MTAPQESDLCLLENGSERSDALVSYAVVVETASEGQDGNGERVGVSMGADTKANTGRGALEVEDHRLLEDGSERGGALSFDAIALETARDE